VETRGHMDFELQPASDYPLPDLVNDLNRGFENYFVPIQFNVSQFLTMLRKDGIDLTASRVLIANGTPSGVALIARRGWTSRLAAMGISTDMRGKGAGTWLMNELIREARERNEREMVLEVIEQNEPAVALYKNSGFETVRRLVGFIRKDAVEDGANDLKEIDLRTAGSLISHYGLPDLPWQLSGETIAQMNPPARAYQNRQAYAVISNPDVEHVVVWSVLVEPEARGKDLAVDMLRNVIARHAGKTWHVPAIFPEEFTGLFDRTGFEKEELSQWQMRLVL